MFIWSCLSFIWFSLTFLWLENASPFFQVFKSECETRGTCKLFYLLNKGTWGSPQSSPSLWWRISWVWSSSWTGDMLGLPGRDPWANFLCAWTLGFTPCLKQKIIYSRGYSVIILAMSGTMDRDRNQNNWRQYLSATSLFRHSVKGST